METSEEIIKKYRIALYDKKHILTLIDKIDRRTNNVYYTKILKNKINDILSYMETEIKKLSVNLEETLSKENNIKLKDKSKENLK